MPLEDFRVSFLHKLPRSYTTKTFSEVTGNSKMASIDLFPGQLVGCTTATACLAVATTATTTTATHANTTAVIATEPFMPKYHNSTIQRYYSSRVPQYNSSMLLQ